MKGESKYSKSFQTDATFGFCVGVRSSTGSGSRRESQESSSPSLPSFEAESVMQMESGASSFFWVTSGRRRCRAAARKDVGRRCKIEVRKEALKHQVFFPHYPKKRRKEGEKR